MTEANPRPMHRDDTGRRRVLLNLSGEVFGGGVVGGAGRQERCGRHLHR